MVYLALPKGCNSPDSIFTRKVSMPYTVLALDLDGTLTDSEKKVSDSSKKTIHEAIAKGVSIVLASGRPLLGVEPIARELDLFKLGGYMLSYNGARIISCKTGEIIWERDIALSEIQKTIDFANKENLAFLSYDKQGVITDSPDDPYVKMEAYNNSIPIKYVQNMKEAVLSPQPKVMIVGKPASLALAQPKLQALLGETVLVSFSEPCFMEITASGVHKASSLSVLLKLLGKDRSELMVIGDGLNDIPMFDLAGFAVAMENSQAETKLHAHAHTASNDNDGVAQAIKTYIL
jgi:Cof subfamily protein (haloacid dehalogenase superfamily)